MELAPRERARISLAAEHATGDGGQHRLEI